MAQTKIVVLDDDPTGSQTVHSCLLLTRWDVDTLRDALLDESPLFFVLTNTRGMDAQAAAQLTAEVCHNVQQALAELEQQGVQINPIFVSRSDSTLRGHYPVETDVMAHLLGPFDAHFLAPAFFEGGRITRDSVHYLMVDGKAVPCHETEFARDSVFGYSTAYLPDYVAEKTDGRIAADTVVRLTLDDMRADISGTLMELQGNQCVVIDGETQQDYDGFCQQLLEAAAQGKRFLFRSAASLLTSLAQLPAQPVAAQSMNQYVRGGKPGAVIVGSHVKKTTAQLQELLRQPKVAPLEINVDLIDSEREALLENVIQLAQMAVKSDKTPVIFTSRLERVFVDQQTRLQFGMRVSAFLMDVVRNLPQDIGFLISKGGITSNDVLSDGLALRTSRVLGQVLAGCSVVRCPEQHPRFANLPVVIFPGNVGDEFGLATVYSRLSGLPLQTEEQQTSALSQ